MPKEITHWLIAEKAAERLAQGTASQALVSHSGMIRLGAILHDVLYYVRSGKAHIRRCTDIANTLHGAHGEDTFALLRMIASDIDSDNKRGFDTQCEASRAFLFGAMTHYCADVVFHPYIYYISGNCLQNTTFFQAWENHRSLEAAIDLAFCNEHHRAAKKFSLLRDISRHSSALQGILQSLAKRQGDFGMNIRWQDYEEGYNTLAWLRLLMVSFVPNTLLDAAQYAAPEFIQTIISAETRSYLGLRYTRQSRWSIPAIRQSFPYRHPVSGEHYTATLADLFEQAVQESLNLWGVLENTVLVGKPLRMQGKSLEVGMQGVPSTAMKTFAEIS